MATDISQIIEPYRGQRKGIIPVLQAVQEEDGYISIEAVKAMSKVLGVSENDIYGVATFYSQFKFEKPGDHIVRVCLGTACHVRGGAELLDVIERDLDAKAGETTEDGKFTLERVACMGCCAVAPVLVVDDEIYGKMSPGKAKEQIKKWREVA